MVISFEMSNKISQQLFYIILTVFFFFLSFLITDLSILIIWMSPFVVFSFIFFSGEYFHIYTHIYILNRNSLK